MQAELSSNSRKVIANKISLIILIIGIAYALIEFVWKFQFVWGHIGGIYWLFVFADRTALPLAGLFFVLTIITFIVYIVMLIIKRENRSAFGKISISSFFASILLASTILIIFPQNTIHLDTKRIRNKVYYLAVYPMFDDNYGLYECDSIGLFCKQVYRSGDYTAGFYARLVYYDTTGEVAVDVNGEGEIYRYKVP